MMNQLGTDILSEFFIRFLSNVESRTRGILDMWNHEHVMGLVAYIQFLEPNELRYGLHSIGKQSSTWSHCNAILNQ